MHKFTFLHLSIHNCCCSDLCCSMVLFVFMCAGINEWNGQMNEMIVSFIYNFILLLPNISDADNQAAKPTRDVFPGNTRVPIPFTPKPRPIVQAPCIPVNETLRKRLIKVRYLIYYLTQEIPGAVQRRKVRQEQPAILRFNPCDRRDDDSTDHRDLRIHVQLSCWCMVLTDMARSAIELRWI
jgi:hypothetical protein